MQINRHAITQYNNRKKIKMKVIVYRKKLFHYHSHNTNDYDSVVMMHGSMDTNW